MSTESINGKSGTVLVIESDAAVRGLLRSILRQHGFGVKEGAGAHALEMCRALGDPVDVILCEDGLPTETGIPVVPLEKPFAIPELIADVRAALEGGLF